MPSASASFVERNGRRIHRQSRARLLCAAVAGALALAAPAHAVDYIWNADGATGAPLGGGGTWDLTNPFWDNAGAMIAWPNASGATATAVFDGDLGFVDLTATVNVNGLRFESNGYTIGGSGTLTLAGTTPTITVTDAADTATISARISGTGALLKEGAGKLVLNTEANNWTGGLTINGGTLEALAPANNIPMGNPSLLGNGGNITINNGSTLRLTTLGSGTILSNNAASRTIVFGAGGGLLDLNGRISANGNANFVLTLNNTGGNVAVVRFNGGDLGLSNAGTPQPNPDWQINGNMLKFNSFTGASATTPLRIELTNGALHLLGTRAAGTVNLAMPYTVRGVVGGDPSSGADGLAHTGVSLNYARAGIDGTSIINFQNGLFLEDAVAVAAMSAARAIDGNITVRGTASGHAGNVAFFGRSTGTALGQALHEPGTNTAGHNVLWVGRGGNDTLTIESGGIAAIDSRVRSDLANHHGVVLNATTVINAGGKLVFRQSLSDLTPITSPTPAAANVGYNIVQGSIRGEGSTDSESVLDIYLPFKDTTTGDHGGIEFQASSNLIVNGTGLGGLRVNGLTRPNALFGAAVNAPPADPDSNAAKIANLLTETRLQNLTGTGGYLTPAPADATFVFPATGEWADGVSVGLRVVNSNTTGDSVDVRLDGNFRHNIHVDAGALLDATARTLGPAAATPNLGRITGTGTIAGGAILDVGSVLAPNDTNPGTIRASEGLTLNGVYEFDAVTPNSRDVLAVTGDLTLGASSTLQVSNTSVLDPGGDYILATYTGSLTGTFGAVNNLPAGFQLDYTGGFIKAFVDRDEKTWTGAASNVWDNASANWSGINNTFSSANRDNPVFNDSATGPTNIVVGAGGVIPGGMLVDNDTKAYSITSSAGSAISGLGGLTKMGPGSLTLSGPNTYTGLVVIGNGTVTVDALANVGTASPLGAGPELVLGTGTTAGTLAYTGSDASTDRTITVAPGGGTVNVGAANVSLTGPISGSGTFTKAGSGRLTLAGPNVGLTGPISINAGTLSTAQISSGTGALTIGNGATFEYTGSNVTDGRGIVIATGQSGTVDVTQATSTLRVTGTSSGGNLVKAGPGALTLDGPVSGTFQIAGGTLALNNSANTVSGVIPVNAGNTLRLGAAGAGGTADVTLAGGTLDLSAAPTGATQGLTAKIYATVPRLVGTNGANDRNPDFDSVAHLNAFAASLTPTVTTSSTTGGVTNMAFTAAAPYGALGVPAVDNVTAYLSGKIFIPVGGDVLFATNSDDGSIIAIDGKTLVNNIGFHGPARTEATVRLTAGFHDIVLGHYEGGGGQAFTALYTLPGGAEVIIPNSALYSGLPTDTAYGNDVTVTSASTISSPNSVGQLGALGISPGADLTLSGLGVRFTSSTLSGGGTYTFNGGSLLDLGTLNAPGAPVTINRNGALALRAGGTALAAGSSVTVNQGHLGVTAAPGANPLGGASVTLGFDSTGLLLSSLGGDVVVDAPITFQSPGDITAGAHNGGVAGTSGSPITVTLGGASSLTGNGNPLRLSSTDNYVLKVANSVTGFGALTMDGGSASLEAASTIAGALNVNSGTLTLNASLTSGNEAVVGIAPPAAPVPSGTPIAPALLVLNAGLAMPTLTVYTGGTVSTTAPNVLQGTNIQVVGGTLNNSSNSIDSASTITMSNAGVVRLDASSNPLTINVGAASALVGDMTNQSFAAGGGPGAISLNADAILGRTSGPEPTRAQLGGATIYQGVTSLNQSLTVGDDGVSSIYKGAAFGSWLAGADPLAFNGTISDGSAGNTGVEVQLGGRGVAVASATTLNTTDTTKGIDFTGKGMLVIGSSPLGSASRYTRTGLPPVNDLDMGTTGHAQGYYVSALNPATPVATFGNVADALGAGKTLAVKHGAVTFTHANNLAAGATVIVDENATVYGSGPTGGGAKLATGSVTVKPTGGVQIPNDFPATPTTDFQNMTLSNGANWTFEDGAVLLINADPRNTGTSNPSGINTTTSAFPSNVDFVLDAAGNHVFTGNGLTLGNNRRISTTFSTNATIARGSGIHATATTEKVFLLASSSPANAGGRTLTILDDLDLTRPGGAGVADLQVGDQNNYMTFVSGDSGARSTTANGGLVRLEGATTARNGSVQTGTLRLHGGNPTFSGPLEVVNSTTTLMIDELDARLTLGDISPDIIVRDGARLQNNINTPEPAGPVVVNQKFTIEGNGGGVEKLFVQRGSGTAALNVEYTNINLMSGAAFDIDEENTVVRASLNLHGDAIARDNATSDPFDLVNVTAVGGPRILQMGEIGQENTTSNVTGTIGSDVTMNLVFGQLFFQTGSRLDGTVQTMNAGAGGDSWVQIRAGQSGVASERIAGTGIIELGSSVDQPTGEDVFGYIDDANAAADPPLINVIPVTVRVVSDSNPDTSDGDIRSERNLDRAGPGGYVRFTDVRPDAGSTLRISGNNASNVIVDLKLQGPNTTVVGVAGAGGFIGSITPSPTSGNLRIGGNQIVNLLSTLNMDVDVVDSAALRVLDRRQHLGEGEGNVFNQNGHAINLNNNTRLAATVDEVATGGTPRVMTVPGPVNIAAGAGVGITADRGVDSNLAGRGVFSSLNAGAGAKLMLQSFNDQVLEVANINAGGDLTLHSASNVNSTTIHHVNVGNVIRNAGVTNNSLTLSGYRTRITGNLEASNVVISAVQANFDPGAGNTRTVAGNAQVQTELNVRSGTLDFGNNVISGKTTTGILGPGLTEGRVSATGQTNNFNLTQANPGTTLQPGVPQANIPLSNTDPGGTFGWSTHTTYVYTGEIFVPAGAGPISFGENFDDAVRVRIGTTDVVNNTAAGTPTVGTVTLTGGQWHPIEIRFGQGGGGVGPTQNDAENWGAIGTAAAAADNNGLGFGWDTQGRNQVNGSNFMNFISDVDGNLLNPDTTTTGFMIRGTTSQVLGNVTVDANSTLKAGAIRNINALTVNGTAQLAPGGGASKVASLTVGAAGRLDLANNSIAVSGGATPATVLTNVTNLIKTGRADGAWNGVGINSAAAAADALKVTAVGVAINNDGSGNPLVPSLSANITDVIARFTYNGDADLSGEVNANDLMRADRGFLTNVDADVNNNLGGWVNGDYNYDGKINIDDFFLSDQAMALQGAPITIAGGPLSAGAPAALSAAASAVPEPATLGLLAVGALGLLRRRRRHA